jgi:gliding motility-associated-like protein
MKKFYQLFLLSLFCSSTLFARVDAIFISTQDPTCFGSMDGYVTIDSLQTTAPSGNYTIRINTSPPQFFNVGDTVYLGDGNYTITVFDGLDGNTPSFRSFSINEPFQLVTVTFGSQTSCFDVCDGTASVFAFDGTPPYTYLWSDNQTTSTATALCDGKYYITVTDNNGCTALDSAVVTEPTQVQPNVAVTDVLCNGDATGSANVLAASGGTGSYVGFQWSSSGNTTATENGLAAGTYTVTVTDSDGCSNTETFVVGEPPVLSTTASKSDVFCFGESTGTATANPSGGVTPYTYLWNDAPTNQTTQTASNLAAGTYTVTVTDNNNCTATASVTVNQRPPLLIDSTVTNVLCNGDATGAITFNISGGTPLYNFVWSTGTAGGGSTTTENGLTAGTYFITVTDALGCTEVDSAIIAEPTDLQISIANQTDPSCVGGTDGSIDITPSGGVAPYTYEWDDLTSTEDRTGLAAGTYTITVTDNNNCTETETITLNNPPPILPNISVTQNVSCRGGSDGIASAAPTGGSGVYVNYQWSSSANTTDTETGLAAGAYTVTVTDDQGCTGSASFNITQPATFLNTSFTKSDVFCFGEATGSINLSVSGGTPGTPPNEYTYIWSDLPITTQDRSNLSAGTYTVTVTDDNGCTETETITVGSRPRIEIDSTVTDVLCNGDATGSVTFTISGGTPTFNYVWSTGTPGVGNSTTENGLTAGTYYITVTDALGCTEVDSAIVSEPSDLVPTITNQTDPLCNGDNNGSIDVSVSGGTGAYTFLWRHDGSTLQNRNDLTAGTYTLVVEDGNGCLDSVTTTLNDPALLTATIDSVRDASCNGLSDGFTRVLASGGTTPYTYNWGSVTTRSNPNIPAGTYTVTVTDNNGCTTTATSIVGQPITVSASINANDASCAGIDDGNAKAVGVGGTQPYTYTWLPAGVSGQGTDSIFNLSGGTYSVTITDNNGCNDAATVTINQPSAVSLTSDKSDAECNGTATGKAWVTATGGTPAYTYLWSTTPVQTTDTAFNLGAGTYFVTVTDNNGCTDSTSVIIDEPTALTANINTSTNPTCNGINDGAATVTAGGGTVTLDYTYLWSVNAGSQTTATATNLPSGTFTVTVTDDNGCTASDQVTITAPPSVVITTLGQTDVNCFGDSTGIIFIQATLGITPYTYTWAPAGVNGQGTALVTNLWAGNYTVTVADNNGCETVANYTISQPASALSVTMNTVDLLCNGDGNGSATANVSGGTPTYSYDWVGSPAGDGTATITGLSGGTYTVTITDDNGCTLVDAATVNEPAPIVISIDASSDVSCFGDNDGSATLSASGGATPYTFDWPAPLAAGNSQTNLSAGSYDVTVTDNNSCQNQITVTISEPADLDVNLLRQQNISCNGLTDGEIEVSGSGGTTPYTFNWSAPNPGNVPINTNLAAGVYTVTITDNNGCEDSLSVTITEPSVLTGTLTVTDEICAGNNDGSIKASISGGTSTYTYLWGPGITGAQGQGTDSIFSLSAGNYTVTVTDNNGCSITLSETVDAATPITATVTADSANCNGEASGRIEVIASGGSGTLSYTWAPISNTGPIASNIPAGNYSITITDAEGCTIVESATVLEPSPLLPTISVNDVSCGGSSNGNAKASVTGGILPYTYNWGPGITVAQGQGTDSIFNINAGNYNLTVTDRNGCDSILSFVVNAGNSSFAFTDSTRDDSCSGVCLGFAGIFNLSGGVSPYTYAWDDGSANSFRDSLCAGNYSVTISDQVGCDTTVSFTINQPSSIAATITTTNDTCLAGIGTATANVSGGTPPYTFNWPAGTVAGNSVSDLNAGNYDLTVTDGNLCQLIEPFTIVNISPLSISLSITDVRCNGDANGEILVSTTGGVNPVTYNWNGSLTGPNPKNLAAGSYNLTVTDAAGCAELTTAVISQPNTLSAGFFPTPESCSPGNDGSVTATPNGGTPPYTFNWGSGNTSQNSNSGLSEGSYNVTVTDSQGCIFTSSYDIDKDATFTIDVVTTDASCNGGTDGTITLTTTGSLPPLTYNWTGGLPGVANHNNVAAGSYVVTVTDASSCTGTALAVVNEANEIEVQDTVINESCASPGGDGKIVLTVSNGAQPYTYNWVANVSPFTIVPPGDTIKDLKQGAYNVTVTDANGCTTIRVYGVTKESDILVGINKVNPSCFGDCNGSITLSPTGGSGNYSFAWRDGATTANRSGLCAGFYNVTVSDVNSPQCIKVENIRIEDPEALSVTFQTFQESCNPGGDGSVRAVADGGTGAYTYNWSAGTVPVPPATQDIAFDLAAGNYRLTLSDANGCQLVESFTISTAPVFTLNTSVTDASCNGVSDGNINTSTVGGVNPLTYNWTGGLSGGDPSAVAAGTYSLTVTDGWGCEQIASVTVGEPPAITASFTITPESCAPGSDGAAAISTTSNGTAPYIYTWSAGVVVGTSTTQLNAGNYDVTVEDATGCTSVVPFTIGSSAPFTVTTSKTDLDCNGDNNGTINVNVSGANGTPTFAWPAPLPPNANQTGLSAGTYTVTVTDNSGCTETATIDILEPDPVAITVNSTDESCSPGGDGSITLSVTGGTVATDYTYTWIPAGPNQGSLTGLSAGTYRVTVTDDNGCFDSTRITIDALPLFNLSGITTDVSCNGRNDGSISLTVTNATGTPTFVWTGSTPPPSGANPNSLEAGTYDVTVTDPGSGCTQTASFTVNEPSALTATLVTNDASCSPGNDGNAKVTASGGTVATDYTYTWSAGTVFNDSVSDLSSGNYFVTITDDNGCRIIENFTIGSDAPYTVTVNTTDVSCNGANDGAIDIQLDATAVPPFTFTWSPNTIAGQSPNPVPPGTYNVTISDFTGCTETETITINEPDAITAVINTTDESCSPGNDGNAKVTASGGTVATDYTYTWSAGTTFNDSVSNLSAGTFTVTITDDNGCQSINNFTIGSDAPFTVDLDSTDVSCNGGSNGAITTTVTGATGTLTFTWSSSMASGQNPSSLVAGTYSVTVTDNTGCSETSSIVVNEPTAISASVSTTPESCSPGNDGTAKVTATGGTVTTDYTYTWPAGGTVFNDSISGLSAGSYNVTITDDNSCVEVVPFSIGSAAPFTLSTDADSVSCNGGNDGRITLTLSGITTPVFTWQAPLPPTQNQSGLAAGSYDVTVTDFANGCTETATITVEEPDPISANAAITPESCSPGNDGIIALTVSGGTPGYQYNWNPVLSNSGNQTGLTAGSYDVTITDQNNCQITSTYVVGSAAPFVVNSSIDDVDCNGGNNGAIDLTITPAAAYTFVWDNGLPATEDQSSLSAGTYNVTITDPGSGCTETGTFNVTEPTSISVASTITDESCVPGNDGSIVLAVSGGTNPYTYDWGSLPNPNQRDQFNLSAGTYTVTVTDNNSCQTVESFVVNGAGSFNVTFISVDPDCNGGSNGSIDLTVTPAAAYTFTWDNSLPATEDQSGLAANTYNVTVTDPNTGCIEVASITLNEPTVISATITTTPESCSPGSDGSITLVAAGGTVAVDYTYTWDNGLPSQANHTGLSANTYNVTISDDNGCSIVEQAVVGTDAPFTLTSATTDPSCGSTADGSIDLTITPAAAYTFAWDNGLAATEDQTNLMAGTYNVTITDPGSGCTETATFTLSAPSPITATLTTTPESCAPGNDGSITTTASGGTVAIDYTYTWDNGLPSQANHTGLSANTYNVTITDDNGCSIVEQAVVGSDAPFTLTSATTDPTCSGDANGSIDLTIAPAAAYTFAWDNSLPATEDQNGLIAGTYNVTVTDPSSGCTETAIFTLTADPISATLSPSQSTCGNADGSITVSNITGGTNPINITWLDASKTPIGQSGTTASNLSSGTYFAAFEDANNCVDTLFAQVNDINGPIFIISSTDESCANACNGTVSVSSPCLLISCTVEWKDNLGNVIGNNPTETGLCSGTYFAEVTDVLTGCISSAQVTVGAANSLDPNFTKVDQGCGPIAVCSGYAKVAPSGGTQPYTFVWEDLDNGGITAGVDSIGSLCPGNFSVTITDAGGCDTSFNFVINPKRTILPNANISDESCFAACDGAISLNPSGGTTPYNFAWSNSAGNVSSQSGLCSGAYTVTITDAAGCDTVVVLNVGTQTFIYNISKTNLSCSGICDGTANVNLTGGSAGYSFTWDLSLGGTGQGTPNVSDLCAGKYYVTITNPGGCSAIDSVTIDPSSSILPGELVTNETCNGLCDGRIELNPSGGVGGTYTYTWSPIPSNGQGVQNALGLCGGNYSVTISDAAGCDTILNLNVQSTTPIIANLQTEDQSCGKLSNCDGRAFTTPSGGVQPYTYTWGPGVITTSSPDTAINLCNGNYFLTITDANGCEQIESFSISSPSPITASFNTVNSTCNICDGELEVIPSGGSGTYSYEWFDASMNSLGVTSTTASSLCAGIYFVVVSDNTGCSEQFSAAVSDNGAEAVSVSSTDVTCFGGNDGSATANFTCSDPSCSVQWYFANSGLPLAGQNSATATNLSAGDYFVEVTNNSGCKTFENVSILQPDEFMIVSSIVDASCSSGCTGSISLNVTGGTGTLSYSWTPAVLTGQGTSMVSNLCAGSYSVRISDANGCDTSLSFVIGEPTLMTAVFTSSEANCGQADGFINAAINGGTVVADYDYQWFDGANQLLVGETQPSLSNVAAGSYALRVRDDNLCEERFTTVLGNINGPTVNIDSTKDAGCFGDNNGAVYISVNGGQSPFRYDWNPTGQTTEDLTGVVAGTYTVQVTDALGCIGTNDTSISESSAILANLLLQDASCGLCNGTATASPSGGTAPYTYLWSNGSTSSTADMLCGGLHSLNIIDAAGCSESFSFSINTSNGPSGEVITATATSCATSCDGSVTVTPIGGTAPYTYRWQHNGATSNSLSGLCKGTYFLQISDVKGCSRIAQVNITSPNELEINEQVLGASCGGGTCDGSILLTVKGGNAPYTYTWGPTPQNDTNYLGDLCAGIYNVTVSDANGCTQTKNINVSNSGNPFTLAPNSSAVSCFGTCDGSLVSNITPSIGIAFQWFDDQGQVAAGLNNDLIGTACPGSYVLVVTSVPDNCKYYASIDVEDQDSITLAASIVKNISCTNSCDGQVFVSTQGGNILYSYSWDDPAAQDVVPAVGLCAGTYSVTATDANGCSKVASVTLNDPSPLVATISSNTNLSCSADCNASAVSSASGGTAPYTFSWSGGQSGSNPNDLCFGINILTVIDALGCAAIDTVNIGATDTVNAIVPNVKIVCDGDSILLKGIVQGSTVTSFGWYENTTSNLLTTTLDTGFVKPIGDYTYFLIASNGNCSDTAEYNVSVVSKPMLNVQGQFTIFKDEVANFVVGNQDISYRYSWNPGTDLNDSTLAEPVSSTRESITYTLTVTDTNNCTFVDSVEVIYSPDLRIPSGISPNGDGKNDVWNIGFLSEFPRASVQVYNRWGELMFESKNGYSKPWDGTYKGKALPVGTYYYVIDLHDNSYKPMTGPITIVK